LGTFDKRKRIETPVPRKLRKGIEGGVWDSQRRDFLQMDNTTKSDAIANCERVKKPFTPPPGKLIIPHAYIADMLGDTRLTGRELRVLLAIVDETVGWNRKTVTQTLGFWAMRSGIRQKDVGVVLAGLTDKRWISWKRGTLGGSGLQGTLTLIHYPQNEGSNDDATLKTGGSLPSKSGHATLKNGGTATLISGGTYQDTINTHKTQSNKHAAEQPPQCADVGFELNGKPEQKQKNGWALWHEVNVALGRKAPAAIPKYTKAAKEILQALNGDTAEFTRVCAAYLKDADPWIVGQGHNLHVLMSKLEKYRNTQSARIERPDPETDPHIQEVLAQMRAEDAAQAAKLPEELQHPKMREAWLRWLKHREQKAAPVTDLELEECAKQMIGWGIRKAIRSINYTIGKGAKGLILEPVIPLKPDYSNITEHLASGGDTGELGDLPQIKPLTAAERRDLWPDEPQPTQGGHTS
jgi:hypothetical protein